MKYLWYRENNRKTKSQEKRDNPKAYNWDRKTPKSIDVVTNMKMWKSESLSIIVVLRVEKAKINWNMKNPKS